MIGFTYCEFPTQFKNTINDLLFPSDIESLNKSKDLSRLIKHDWRIRSFWPRKSSFGYSGKYVIPSDAYCADLQWNRSSRQVTFKSTFILI